MAASHLKLVAPNSDKRTTPKRGTNASYRTREHLVAGEIERLLDATQCLRDRGMILVAFRHGLRASELCDLRWDQIDFAAATMHVRRLKHGTEATHPIEGDELRLLRRLQRETASPSPFVFVSNRGAPFTRAGFARLVERAGVAAGLELKVHAHMLRHSCGFELARRGVDTRAIQGYLGHRCIEHTVAYTALAPGRFANIWRD